MSNDASDSSFTSSSKKAVVVCTWAGEGEAAELLTLGCAVSDTLGTDLVWLTIGASSDDVVETASHGLLDVAQLQASLHGERRLGRSEGGVEGHLLGREPSRQPRENRVVRGEALKLLD